jgi:hypothetical protein
MRRLASALAAAACVGALGAAGIAAADPGEDHGHDDIPVPTPGQPLFPPGSSNMDLLGLADKDGTTNSDIAFYKDLAFAGNYDGFRIVDIKRPAAMRVLSDTKCRANQGDVSVFKTRDDRVIMLQSIDRPVTAPDCTGVDTATTTELQDENGQWTATPSDKTVTKTRARFGYEGLRVFDVTDPANPRFIKFFRTECGSHTHTLVPDPKNNAVHAYVASYPLGSHITPQVDWEAAGDLRCDAPHSKISIVSFPLTAPESGVVRTKPLSSDTEPYDPDGPFRVEHGAPHGSDPAFQSCHDHQAVLARDIMIGSCAGDAQYWSISRRGNPTSADGEPHTHIKREVRADDTSRPRTESFDFIHNAVATWDGKIAAITDESGGGVEARCDGDQSKRGFTFFYPLVRPGTPVDGFADLKGRYMIPRPQNTETCVSHNGSILPVKGRYLYVQAFYQGGNSLYEFTDPANPKEIGFADLETAEGKADSWSAYWYNGAAYVNGGLNRRGATENRGFEAYRLRDADGSPIETRKWKHSNPQTQEAWQAP